MFESALERLRSQVSCPVLASVPLAPLNTFGIGGPAACLVQAQGPDDIAATLKFCHSEEVSLYVLGGGSNIIVPDAGIDGVVLHLASGLSSLVRTADGLTAQAGVTDQALAEFALAHRLTGFEWIYDIPGSVGGAVYMNAGNNDGEIRDNVTLVDWIDLSGHLVQTPAADLALGYRSSRFQSDPGIIVAAHFGQLAKEAPEVIRQRMDSIRSLRQSKFPEETLCAGSIFKRPPGHYAGKLIEDAECGGMTVGGALVSQKHKGFIVNTGSATASDVLTLIQQVKTRVLEDSGVQLTTEVEAFAPLLDYSSKRIGPITTDGGSVPPCRKSS